MSNQMADRRDAPPSGSSPIRVMVVDDSAIVRGLVSRWLGEAPGVEVVSSQPTGTAALAVLATADPDVVLLDIDMPGMDGLAALERIRAGWPDVAVVMASTLTRRNAEISLRALAMGARHCIAKPHAAHGLGAAGDYRRELVDTVIALGRRRQSDAAPKAAPAPTPSPLPVPVLGASPPIALRAPSATLPRVLVIGSSTGGPPALMTVLETLGHAGARIPVLIAQHMPATFTGILAEHLGRACARPTAEAKDGEPVVAGRVYVAPGGCHMRVAGAGRPTIRLDAGGAIHNCRPAVDPLFESAAAVYAAATLALVLTGMGRDATEGARRIAEAGGTVIAQDEASSVVWGMPGSAARAGLCSAVLPLGAIGGKLAGMIGAPA